MTDAQPNEIHFDKPTNQTKPTQTKPTQTHLRLHLIM
jgi:hypothetical protein